MQKSDCSYSVLMVRNQINWTRLDSTLSLCAETVSSLPDRRLRLLDLTVTKSVERRWSSKGNHFSSHINNHPPLLDHERELSCAQQHNSTTAQQQHNSTTAQQQHNSTTTAQQHNSTTAYHFSRPDTNTFHISYPL